MKVFKLTTQEAATSGFTHLAKITHDDLTETGSATAQAITIATPAAGSILLNAAQRLKTAFADSSDSANASTVLTLGDGTTANKFLAASQLNANTADDSLKSGTGTKNDYTSAGQIVATFTPGTGKTLAALDTGEVHIFLQIAELQDFD